MSDLNELNGLPNDSPVVPVAKAADEQALHDEMEELAKVFQAELDRAKAEAKEVAENVPVDPEIDLSDAEQIPAATEKTVAENAPIPEEELCDCCGEKRRGTAENPNAPFCAECDAGLRHYPFDFLNLFFALIAICFVFYGGYVFANHTETFVAVQKADSLRAEKKTESALDAYTAAANTMINNHINGELVYKREILLAYNAGYFSNLSEPVENIHTWELSLPHFRTLKRALDDAAAFLTTWEAADAMISASVSSAANPSDLPYDALIAKLDAMKAAEVVTESSESETTTAANAYTPKVEHYAPSAIAFYKYQLALICSKDLQTQIAFLEEFQAEAPQHVLLYAPLLVELYAKTGRDIEPLCSLIENTSTEDCSPALAHAIQKRIAGQPDESMALCDDAIAAYPDFSEEFYRQKALILLAQGNYSEAYTTVNTVYQESSSPSFQTVYTVAVCAAAAGEETAYNEIISLLNKYDYSVPKEVTGYKDGSVTLQQILFEGDYDIS